jgi:hypothetical protein
MLDKAYREEFYLQVKLNKKEKEKRNYLIYIIKK